MRDIVPIPMSDSKTKRMNTASNDQIGKKTHSNGSDLYLKNFNRRRIKEATAAPLIVLFPTETT
jgi:hypothetical protein